jgi:hypothetical protein
VTENIVYFVEIPARSDRGFEQRAAEWVAELRLRGHFDSRPWFDEGAANLREAAVTNALAFNREIRSWLLTLQNSKWQIADSR